ncbi:MAG TPA: hypothetical protein VFQ11_10875, partial [Nocardioidaceae bacterium]|nr:hypothetical protein [Nocardioidaceae bacterium]
NGGLMSTVACPTCHNDYTARKDGQPRKHPCVPADNPGNVALPWCTPPLTQNQLRRMHPLAEASAKKAALKDARWAIRAARLTPMLGANVVLHWRMPDRRRRDGDGAAPTLKVVLDALVAEGVIPDDSFVHVPFSGIRCHPPRPGIPGGMWLEITDPDQEAI